MHRTIANWCSHSSWHTLQSCTCRFTLGIPYRPVRNQTYNVGLCDNKRHSSVQCTCPKPRLVYNSLIHSEYLYSAPSRNRLRGALSPATAKEKCLKKLAEGRHFVLGQQ